MSSHVQLMQGHAEEDGRRPAWRLVDPLIVLANSAHGDVNQSHRSPGDSRCTAPIAGIHNNNGMVAP